MPEDDETTRSTDAPLQAYRQQIDEFDAKIVDLLNARARVVVNIGKLKQQSNAPIYSPDRERVVLDKVRKLNAGPLPDRCLEAVYRELMSGSFALEKPLKIGFLGPLGHVHATGRRSEVRQQCDACPACRYPFGF